MGFRVCMLSDQLRERLIYSDVFCHFELGIFSCLSKITTRQLFSITDRHLDHITCATAYFSSDDFTIASIASLVEQVGHLETF